MSLVIWVIVVIAVIFLASAIRVVREYERGVIFRLGRLVGAKGPGLFFVVPFIDQLIKIDLRVVTMDVPKQSLITRDNVPVTVDAVVYFRVLSPEDAITKVENYIAATSLISQTTLRSVVGQSELDELLIHRDKINEALQKIIDEKTDPWGIKVSAVEIKEVVLPEELKRAMARQAETERERRAKIISAEGEFQAAEKLSQAAEIIARNPVALQLRYLQTLSDISAETATTIFFPLPLEFLKAFGIKD
ncbi:slipin family protein [Candidatus Sordicultor fermentans]|jgi:regulator of protease activity HflC (stomatin/prohibitin superfamily)|uniref:slipin family protein n=1 Tax=Candidatus Sordicultor fermentans TaxID=1953203 RepID=UPI0016A5C721|nr:slipin family protein [Atribacterota bacterium]MDI9607107.1 slipin family protein [Atribacterota bacterium]NLY05773.1 slipin family protein [Candidatus Atribacteria bacterium]